MMSVIASQITSLTIACSTAYSGADEKKPSKLCVTGLCAGKSPGNSPHKWSVTRKMFPFDDVIMCNHSSITHTIITRYGGTIPTLLHQNDVVVTMSFNNDDVIVTSCITWAGERAIRISWCIDINWCINSRFNISSTPLRSNTDNEIKNVKANRHTDATHKRYGKEIHTQAKNPTQDKSETSSNENKEREPNTIRKVTL